MAAVLLPLPVTAQTGPSLTLAEAIELARANNPELLMQRNNEEPAEWGVRQAYGSLLPGASVSAGMQYQAEGTPALGIFTGEDFGLSGGQSYLYSDYSLGLTYRLSGADLFRVPQARANLRATTARIGAADATLVGNVKRQYVAAQRARDGVALAEQELARAEQNLELARARFEVGEVIELEAKQAEVERGRAEVELIRARNTHETEKLRLIQLVGTEIERSVRLTTDFEVFEPGWTAAELIALAMDASPQLAAERAGRRAGEAAVRVARSAYFPTLDMSLGWSGFAREVGNPELLVQQAERGAQETMQSCGFFNAISDRLSSPLPGFPTDCSQFALTEQQRDLIRSSNEVFPFDFTQQPLTFRLSVSLPIFNGFTRQAQLEEARAQSDDARYRVRAEELRIRAEVTAGVETLEAAQQAVALERRNAQLAAEQLELARERYRLGLTSFVDLLESETLKARADRAYLNAVHAFHDTLANLETAVGVPLRPAGSER